jgi:hypothetical protein
MDSPLSMALYYEPIFNCLLSYIGLSELYLNIAGLFKEGHAKYVHLLANVRSAEGTEKVLSFIKDDKNLLL